MVTSKILRACSLSQGRRRRSRMRAIPAGWARNSKTWMPPEPRTEGQLISVSLQLQHGSPGRFQLPRIARGGILEQSHRYSTVQGHFDRSAMIGLRTGDLFHLILITSSRIAQKNTLIHNHVDFVSVYAQTALFSLATRIGFDLAQRIGFSPVTQKITNHLKHRRSPSLCQKRLKKEIPMGFN